VGGGWGGGEGGEGEEKRGKKELIILLYATSPFTILFIFLLSNSHILNLVRGGGGEGRKEKGEKGGGGYPFCLLRLSK